MTNKGADMDDENKNVSRRPLPTWVKWASAVTVVWMLLFVSVFLWGEDILGLERNELGDFVGGFFAPVALLWVVIGVLQQGEELRLQQKELRRHVEATSRLVETDREMLHHEREKWAAEEQRRWASEERQRPAFHYRATDDLGNGVWFAHFESLGGEFTIMKIHSWSGLTDVALMGDGTTLVKPGAKPTFRLLGPKGPVRWECDVSYGSGRVGKMEIQGVLGSPLSVHLDEGA